MFLSVFYSNVLSYAEFFTDDDDNGAKPDGGYSLDSDDTTIQLETLTVIGGGELSQRRKANAPTTTTTTTTTTSSVMSVGDVEADKNLAAVMPHLTEFEKYAISLVFVFCLDKANEVLGTLLPSICLMNQTRLVCKRNSRN